MKEFKLRNKEIVGLHIQFNKISKFIFPGVLKIYNNILLIESIITDINNQYKKILHGFYKDNVNISDVDYPFSERIIPISSFDVTKHSVIGDLDLELRAKLISGLDKINNKEVKVKLEELDVSLPVFLFENKMKVILKDYLEQIIKPIDLLFYPAKIGIIKNLF